MSTVVLADAHRYFDSQSAWFEAHPWHATKLHDRQHTGVCVNEPIKGREHLWHRPTLPHVELLASCRSNLWDPPVLPWTRPWEKDMSFAPRRQPAFSSFSAGYFHLVDPREAMSHISDSSSHTGMRDHRWYAKMSQRKRAN